MKKRILILALFMGAISFVQAQDYNTAVGLRGGFYNGISLKHYLGGNSYFEGLLSSAARYSGFHVTALYEIHKEDAWDVDRLNWYYGVGAHAGIYSDGTVSGAIALGADGILGLEYNIPEIPINISVDWKPSLNLFGYGTFLYDGGAFSIRYIIK